jgi:hypothetical protein
MPAKPLGALGQPPQLLEAATLLAAAILRLHQRNALAEKESPKSVESSLDAGEKTGLMDTHGLTV